jgi:hypothetical protein
MTVSTLGDLPAPAETSVSIVTNAKVSSVAPLYFSDCDPDDR